MNATDILWLDIFNRLKLLPKEFESELREKIKALIQLERKDVKNKQLVSVNARNVRAGDLIFDFKKKTVQKIHYAEYRRKCQFGIDKDNNEMLFSYSEDEPCDYFDEFDEVMVLLDIAEVDSINNRELLELYDEDY